jgi:hypothetical protein
VTSEIHSSVNSRAADTRLRELACDLRWTAELSPSEAVAMIGDLVLLQAAVAARLQMSLRPASEKTARPESDRLLTAEDVAKRFDRSVAWVYRQSRHWSFTRRVTRRTLRFSETGLKRFLAGSDRGHDDMR